MSNKNIVKDNVKPILTQKQRVRYSQASSYFVNGMQSYLQNYICEVKQIVDTKQVEKAHLSHYQKSFRAYVDRLKELKDKMKQIKSSIIPKLLIIGVGGYVLYKAMKSSWQYFSNKMDKFFQFVDQLYKMTAAEVNTINSRIKKFCVKHFGYQIDVKSMIQRFISDLPDLFLGMCNIILEGLDWIFNNCGIFQDMIIHAALTAYNYSLESSWGWVLSLVLKKANIEKSRRQGLSGWAKFGPQFQDDMAHADNVVGQIFKSTSTQDSPWRAYWSTEGDWMMKARTYHGTLYLTPNTLGGQGKVEKSHFALKRYMEVFGKFNKISHDLDPNVLFDFHSQANKVDTINWTNYDLDSRAGTYNRDLSDLNLTVVVQDAIDAGQYTVHMEHEMGTNQIYHNNYQETNLYKTLEAYYKKYKPFSFFSILCSEWEQRRNANPREHTMNRILLDGILLKRFLIRQFYFVQYKVALIGNEFHDRLQVSNLDIIKENLRGHVITSRQKSRLQHMFSLYDNNDISFEDYMKFAITWLQHKGRDYITINNRNSDLYKSFNQSQRRYDSDKFLFEAQQSRWREIMGIPKIQRLLIQIKQSFNHLYYMRKYNVRGMDVFNFSESHSDTPLVMIGDKIQGVYDTDIYSQKVEDENGNMRYVSPTIDTQGELQKSSIQYAVWQIINIYCEVRSNIKVLRKMRNVLLKLIIDKLLILKDYTNYYKSSYNLDKNGKRLS